MVAFVQWVKALPLWVIGIVLIVLVILLWKFYDMINKYKFKIVRKKPEKMVKPAEKVDSTNTNNISGSV
jgi:Na+-transporting methylmalonyl-CoA/oxaloacetate decarboxylase gamma subunit